MIPATLHNLKDGKTYKTDAHQVEAYEHLMCNPRAALLLGMSLSKTVTALSYLYDMHYTECAITKTLVVAPNKVANITWPDELHTWAHLDGVRYSLITGDATKREKALSADAEIFIIGVDNLGWLIDKFLYKKISEKTGEPYGAWLGALPFDCVVIDELSLFKGRGSNRFKKLRRALDLSDTPYRVGMTGTFVPNGYVDAWAQMVLIDDGERLGDTFGKFSDKYFTTRGNGMIVYEYIPRPGAVQTIARKIQDIALTMLTRDKVKLPDLHIVDHEIELSPFDKDTYDDLEREYALDFLKGGEVTVKSAADLTNKLLQVSSGAIYIDSDGPRKWYELNTAKLDTLDALLAQYAQDNFICVYQFRHELERIKARFPFARELRKVEDFRDWNAGKIRLLLIHPKGSGHGLNMQFGGRRMVWFSVTWNLEHYLQTIARLLRRGALKEIFIHRLLCKGTRDMRVRKRVETKDSNQTFLLNEIKDLRKKYGTKRK